MAHHKRKRPKNRRAGCLMCKPHKANGVKKRKFSDCSARGRAEVSGPWKQEYKAGLKLREQKDEGGW